MGSSRLILHADLDAFFASVETRDDPRLAGKPVIVGADPHAGRGVVSACSYEARRFGVHSAMPIGEARRRCPHAIFRPVRMDRYRHFSRIVFGIFAEFSPVVEPLSIDEAFLDIGGMERLAGPAPVIAERLRQRVRECCGLAVSVGIAAKKFIAKIASDLAKPDGYLVVGAGEERRFLAPLPVTRLWGVGPVLAEQLGRLGLVTIGALADWPGDDLARRFGASGRALQRLARGEDERDVVPGSAPLSSSREITFPRNTADRALLLKTLRTIALEVSADLFSRGLVAATVFIKLRTPDFRTILRSHTLAEPAAADSTLYAAACDLFSGHWEGQELRLLGMGVKKLSPPREQSLFLGNMPEAARDEAAAAVHRIRNRFGAASIMPATLLDPPAPGSREPRSGRRDTGREGRP